MKHWILLSKENTRAVWIVPEGDQYIYEIAPEDNLRKGDIVYLWSNPHRSFFGWGEVAETPKTFMGEFPRPNNDIELKKRMSVLVNRRKEFHPPITEAMMRWDTNLRKLIPEGFDDLCVISLRPGQANYINDFVREHKLEPPKGSSTVDVKFEKPEPEFELKTVVRFGENTDEGTIIEAVTLPWFNIIERLIKDRKLAYEISPRQWEEIIAGAYRQAGWEVVILTPRSGDYGRDVIATKHALGEVRVIDQVKAYKPGHLVTADDVRALAGLLHEDGASKGFLTTTSDFAPKLRLDPLIAPLIPKKLGLVNGDKLIQRLIELRDK